MQFIREKQKIRNIIKQKKFEFKMLDNCDSVRKGLIYTPNMNEHLEDELVISFEQKRGINYQHEYMRLYIANVVLTQQLKELLQEKGDLITKIGRLEENDNVKSHHYKHSKHIEEYSEQPRRQREHSEMLQKSAKHYNECSQMQQQNQHTRTKYQQDENVNPNQHQYQTRKLIKKN